MLCSDPILAILRINIILIIYNVYFFKVRANERFCSKRKNKEESMERKTRSEREREREAITHCIQFFICLCSLSSSYNLK